MEKSRQWFVWNGDRNFYQDVDVFWMVRNLDAEIPPEEMTFGSGKKYWGASRENQPSRDPLLWKRSPNADQPLHARTTADYTLEDPTFGDAAAGPPGFRADRLPLLPPELYLDEPSPASTIQ